MHWREPDAFLTAKAPDGAEVTVYHAYKDGWYEDVLIYHFSTSYTDDGDTFDVRDLKLVRENYKSLREKVHAGDRGAIRRVVRMSVRKGYLAPVGETP